MDARTRGLLEAPVVPVLLRLAAPNVLVMLAQATTGLIEAYIRYKTESEVDAIRMRPHPWEFALYHDA